MKGRADSPSIPRKLGDHEERIRTLEFAHTALAGRLRILAGAVLNDGGPIAGAGFTVDWDSGNLYTITFDIPFSEPGPVVALTPNNNNPAGSEGEYGVSLQTRDPAFIVVETTQFDGTATDGGFDFLCVEAS